MLIFTLPDPFVFFHFCCCNVLWHEVMKIYRTGHRNGRDVRLGWHRINDFPLIEITFSFTRLSKSEVFRKRGTFPLTYFGIYAVIRVSPPKFGWRCWPLAWQPFRRWHVVLHPLESRSTQTLTTRTPILQLILFPKSIQRHLLSFIKQFNCLTLRSFPLFSQFCFENRWSVIWRSAVLKTSYIV